MMKRTSLYFVGSEDIEVRDEDLNSPEKDEVLVENEISSISAGSELLFYREQVEEGIPIDEEIEKLNGDIDYPLKYGYSSVGRVKELGEEVPSKWEERRVFSFHPHESHFLAHTKNLIPAPGHLTSKEISFLPSLETAINLIIDGRPIIGDALPQYCVIIFRAGSI